MLFRRQPKKGNVWEDVIAVILGGTIGIYLLATLIIYLFQDKVAFNLGKSSNFQFPNSSFKEVFLPDQLGMTYRNLTILSQVDQTGEQFDELYGWFIYHEGISHTIPTIVYFHENDYYPPARLYMIEKMYNNPQKYNVIMVDYRGYGYSTGKPSEDGLYFDCQAIMNTVLSMEEIDQNQVFIFGASLGGAMATYSALLYQDKVQGLILQNTITSAYGAAMYHAPILKPAFKVGLKIKLPSIERIKNIKLPMLFIVGLNDKLTGPEEMYELSDAAIIAPSKTTYKIPGCDHYLTWYYGGTEFDNQLTSYINGALLSKSDGRSNMEKMIEESRKTITESTNTAFDWIKSYFE